MKLQAFIYGACVSCSRLLCIKFTHTAKPFAGQRPHDFLRDLKNVCTDESKADCDALLQMWHVPAFTKKSIHLR